MVPVDVKEYRLILWSGVELALLITNLYRDDRTSIAVLKKRGAIFKCVKYELFHRYNIIKIIQLLMLAVEDQYIINIWSVKPSILQLAVR